VVNSIFCSFIYFVFFQAEDGIRDFHVTGVQTCALPISEYMDGNNPHPILSDLRVRQALSMAIDRATLVEIGYGPTGKATCNIIRSEERRVGKESRSRGSQQHEKKKGDEMVKDDETKAER